MSLLINLQKKLFNFRTIYRYQPYIWDTPSNISFKTPQCSASCKNGIDYQKDKHFGGSMRVIAPGQITAIQRELYTRGYLFIQFSSKISAFWQAHNSCYGSVRGFYGIRRKLNGFLGLLNKTAEKWKLKTETIHFFDLLLKVTEIHLTNNSVVWNLLQETHQRKKFGWSQRSVNSYFLNFVYG